jgi:hypothetical protein
MIKTVNVYKSNEKNRGTKCRLITLKGLIIIHFYLYFVSCVLFYIRDHVSFCIVCTLYYMYNALHNTQHNFLKLYM